MKCTTCNAAQRVADAGAPVVCGTCGERTMVYAKTCLRCGQTFNFTAMGRETNGVVCPFCKARYSPPVAKDTP